MKSIFAHFRSVAFVRGFQEVLAGPVFVLLGLRRSKPIHSVEGMNEAFLATNASFARAFNLLMNEPDIREKVQYLGEIQARQIKKPESVYFGREGDLEKSSPQVSTHEDENKPLRAYSSFESDINETIPSREKSPVTSYRIVRTKLAYPANLNRPNKWKVAAKAAAKPAAKAAAKPAAKAAAKPAAKAAAKPAAKAAAKPAAKVASKANAKPAAKKPNAIAAAKPAAKASGKAKNVSITSATGKKQA